MKTGFTFKGKHTNEFGIIAKTKSRSILPSVKKYSYEPPCMDGSYDFSEANAYGHEFYNDRVFSVSLTVIAANIFELQKKLSQIALWLRGKGELIFDDMPRVKWQASVCDNIDTLPQICGKKAVLDVNFSAKPFSRWAFDINEGYSLENSIPLDDKLPLDPSLCYSFENAGNSITVPFINMGSWYAKPIITVDGISYLNTMTMQTPDSKIYCHVTTHTITIDCEKQTIIDMYGNSIMSASTIEKAFPEFEPGTTMISFSTNAYIEKIKVKIEYAPKYLYDYDYDVDWSAADA